MAEIDELDRHIIDYLLVNGPAPNVLIAEALETSEATVRRRRTRLESEGIIKFVCTVDPLVIGSTAAAMVGLKIEANKITEVEAVLKKMDEIQFLGLSTGGYDLMLEMWAPSHAAIGTFTTETIGKIDGVRSLDVFVLTRISKYSSWQGLHY